MTNFLKSIAKAIFVYISPELVEMNEGVENLKSHISHEIRVEI